MEVEKVVPNPFQPRREFDQNKLQELADSIRMYGVLQPLTVTRNEVQQDNGTFYTEYELIAGERRLRASKLAGVAQVPVIIREGEQNEQEKLELAIIENLQREDLNAVDRAIAFRQLADQFGLSHAQVAQKVGRSREYVSNSIRLLGLPEHMLTSLKRGEMMEGHARTLLMLTDRPEEQEVVYKEILLKKLSVREVERIVRKIATDKVRKKNPGEFDASLIAFEKQFTETLGTRVQIQKTDFGGKLTIDYFSEDDLEAILKRMGDEVVMQAPTTKSEMAARISEDTPLMVDTDTVAPVPEQPESRHNDLATQPTVVPLASEPKPAQPADSSFVADSHQHMAAAPQPYSQPYVEQSAPKAEPQTEEPVVGPTAINADHSPQQPEETVQKQSHYPYDNHLPTPVAEEVEIPARPVEQPAPQAPTPPSEDESGLYSIRNFNV